MRKRKTRWGVLMRDGWNMRDDIMREVMLRGDVMR